MVILAFWHADAQSLHVLSGFVSPTLVKYVVYFVSQRTALE